MSNTTTTFKSEMESLFKKREEEKEKEQKRVELLFAELEGVSAVTSTANKSLDFKAATAATVPTSSKPTLFDFDDM